MAVVITVQLSITITMQDNDLDPTFPSFAASPNHSPSRFQFSQNSQAPNNQQITKITIELPQSLVESTLDENSHFQSVCKEQQGQNIRVYCRFRPAVHPTHLKYDHSMVDDGQNRYSFDAIYGDSSCQSEIYTGVADRHIEAFFKGHNSTIFTYGQTGSGKTYTMFGELKNRQGYGLIPRALEQIFRRKVYNEDITCSILEIYNEKLIDLFDPLKQSTDRIKIKEHSDSVTLEGLVQVRVDNHHEVMDLIRFGYRDRKIATTYNNDCSSRSHTILFVYRTYPCGDKSYRNKLCFIDLAGSQKIRKSGVKGQTLEEAKKINLSLSCLGNVVSALTSSAEHIPYRNSKLTRILKDSLNGFCRTSIITTCSSERVDNLETISTIRFAVRAKRIKNKIKLQNSMMSHEEIIQGLKKQLAVTKKQLEFYKLKEKINEKEKQQDQIPEQAVVYRPIRGSQFSGVASRIGRSIDLPL